MGSRNLTASAVALLIPLLAASAKTAEEITWEKMLATSPEWQEKYEQYQPEPDMIDALKAKIARDVSIVVYLGLWCEDSRDNVPLFIKILDRLGSGIPVRYFRVPRKANSGIKYYSEELKIERVPTFIIYRGNREIGRIVENPSTGMLEDLMEIFFKEN